MKIIALKQQKNENNHKSKAIIWVSYAYIMLPFFIFSIGWFGKRYWIPMLPVLLVCYWKACKDSSAFWIPEFTRDNIIRIVFILLVIFMWVYYSGIGRLVFQNTDHTCRNAIYEILVNYDWPIYNYDVYTEGTSATSLIYYIGFWLPSAVIGKLWGISAGYGFQVFWAILGIALVYYFICAQKEKLLVWPLAILIFFSGLDIVGYYLLGANLFDLANDAHLEWWVSPYQYSSMTTQLFWVFNQAIPAWLCTILAYIQKNNRSIILILACCMLPGTFPFVGLLVFVLYWVFSRKYNITLKVYRKDFIKEYVKAFIKDTFTVQNIFGGGIIGIFSFLYLCSNVSGGRFMQASTYGASYNNHLAKYLMFILLEVGVYFIALYKYNKSKGIYWVALISLLIIPPIKIGNSGDFCMRVSIPALFVLALLFIDALEKAKKESQKELLVGLTIIFCIGSITPLHEMTRTFQYTVERLNNEKQLYEITEESSRILNGSNFSGSTEDSFFFKYIAR